MGGSPGYASASSAGTDAADAASSAGTAGASSTASAVPIIGMLATLVGTAANIAKDSQTPPPTVTSVPQTRPDGSNKIPFPTANVAASLPTQQLSYSNPAGSGVPTLGSEREYNLGHLLAALNGGRMK